MCKSNAFDREQSFYFNISKCGSAKLLYYIEPWSLSERDGVTLSPVNQSDIMGVCELMYDEEDS